MAEDDTIAHFPVSDQLSLFGEGLMEPAPRQSYRPDPADIRSKLLGVLETARAAPAAPWPERDFRFWTVVFPQMSDWLSDEEADQLRFEFAREVARLKAA